MIWNTLLTLKKPFISDNIHLKKTLSSKITWKGYRPSNLVLQMNSASYESRSCLFLRRIPVIFLSFEYFIGVLGSTKFCSSQKRKDFNSTDLQLTKWTSGSKGKVLFFLPPNSNTFALVGSFSIASTFDFRPNLELHVCPLSLNSLGITFQSWKNNSWFFITNCTKNLH